MTHAFADARDSKTTLLLRIFQDMIDAAVVGVTLPTFAVVSDPLNTELMDAISDVMCDIGEEAYDLCEELELWTVLTSLSWILEKMSKESAVEYPMSERVRDLEDLYTKVMQ